MCYHITKSILSLTPAFSADPKEGHHKHYALTPLGDRQRLSGSTLKLSNFSDGQAYHVVLMQMVQMRSPPVLSSRNSPITKGAFRYRYSFRTPVMEVGAQSHCLRSRSAAHMIPLSQIKDEDLFCQDDAKFLMGAGFTEKAARKQICRACKCGALVSKYFQRRYWFSGMAFKKWVKSWFGSERIRLDVSACQEHSGTCQGKRSRATKKGGGH